MKHTNTPSKVGFSGNLFVACAFMVSALFAGPASADTLTTIFATNNSFAGNTFDIEVIGTSPIEITSFDVNLSNQGSTNTIAVYWRPGTSDGFQDDASGWTLLGKDTNVVSNGSDTPTPVDVGGLVMEPGETYGIYIDLESFDGSTVVLYTNAGEPTEFTDSNLLLTTFYGRGNLAFQGANFVHRIWNGNVNYNVGVDDGFTRFRVTKDFLDNNTGNVTVSIACNTGLILDQDFDLGDGEFVEFQVENFINEDGFWCEITESDTAGYTGSFVANGGSADTSCYYTGGETGNIGFNNTCAITNQADYVNVTIGKDWLVPGAGGDVVDMDIYVDVQSAGEISGGFPCGINDLDYCIKVPFIGDSPADQVVKVRPAFGGTMVYLTEGGMDQFVEADSTCGTGTSGSVKIEPAMGASCTFTNTVFFEGIPTLNQYGMALLALLMLGMGMIGFRRYV